MFSRLKNMGPGVLVTAAFIGPGTVTACTLAGANYGYTLLWALVFATFATIVLQEMSARLGTITQKGLGETLINELQTSIFKWPLIGLLLAALYAGNAAYEAGNLAGGALGIEAIFGDSPMVSKLSVIAIAGFGGLVLLRGSYKDIEHVLIGLVLLMGISFTLTFFVVQPSLLGMLGGMSKPTIPSDGLLTVVALIGTTVVPYNLFLHASAAKARWQGEENLAAARSDTVISIGLGGVVAILIVSTASASIYANALSVNSAADMAVQFEPLFGSLSKYLLGMGLFAAGLSSAITAPLATGFAVSELMKLKGGERSPAFKAISISVLLVGAALALLGIKPIKLILLAQFANGLLLPIVACFLLFVMNRKNVLGPYVNGVVANLLGVVVIVLTATLGARLVLKSFGFL
ncbi:MAG: NRAMP (natural resistance-associated macrophage protein)-like metal ion transporter [Arenicella sp.]|jgi:NRAMP (natural resistance-associated macrophage protein)-like metal ion transporter